MHSIFDRSDKTVDISFIRKCIGCLSSSFSRPQHLFRWQFLQFLLLAASERQPWLEKILPWDARQLANLDFESRNAHMFSHFFGSIGFICLWLNRGSSGGMHVQPLYSILTYAAPRNLVLRHENRDQPKRCKTPTYGNQKQNQMVL